MPYKYCFVPCCTSTTVKTPGKSFIAVPLNPGTRKKWFEVARRADKKISPKTTFYCCEDHFNVEEDFSNIIKHRMMGCRLQVKDGVLPSKFDCQSNRLVAHTPKERALPIKRRKKALLELTLEEASFHVSGSESSDFSASTEIPMDFVETCFNVAENEKSTQVSINTSHASSQYVQESVTSKQCQVNLKRSHCRSKGSQYSVPKNSIACSPMKQKKTLFSQIYSSTEDESSQYSITTSSEEITDSSCSSEGPISNNILNLIAQYPKRYLGIPKKQMYVIYLLSKTLSMSSRDIFITLMKIKLNDSFERLGDQFLLSKTRVASIFHDTIPFLAKCFQTLIFFPKHNKFALPISFRANYSNVQSIIDCFEIQIQKPSNPIEQALTWSEYKRCNTIKYLVSCSPHGYINYISKGYGGRISDQKLFSNDFLDKLPDNCVVMADRGFKNIESLLATKNCKLVRPPSVNAGSKLTQSEVLHTKRIAALRIHVERLVKRYREFKILLPHSTVDHSLICCLDDIVITSTGIINLQRELLKR